MPVSFLSNDQRENYGSYAKQLHIDALDKASACSASEQRWQRATKIGAS